MNISVHTEPFHYIVIEELWDEKEKTKMLEEMLYFEKKGLFRPPEETGSATNADEEILKMNTALFVDDIYLDRDTSDILKYNRKIFDVLFVMNEKFKESWFFNEVNRNVDRTLVSYYEDSCYYKGHKDESVMTTVSWFFKEPKKFKGGDISFPDYDLTFEVSTDMVIIFPSNIVHSVSEISIDDNDKGKQFGRFCMSNFLYNNYVPPIIIE